VTQSSTSTVEYVDLGRLNIRIDRHWDCTSVIVTYHDGLNRAFPTNAEADAYVEFLKTIEAQRLPIYVIEEQAGVWTSAAAVVDQAEQDMLDGIAANLVKPETVDVSDILATGQSWAAFRQATTRTAAPVTEAMQRVLDSADTRGYITRGENASSKQLIALEHRGRVKLHRTKVGREHRIAGAWLAGTANTTEECAA
jgi:hypothetical protein